MTKKSFSSKAKLVECHKGKKTVKVVYAKRTLSLSPVKPPPSTSNEPLTRSNNKDFVGVQNEYNSHNFDQEEYNSHNFDQESMFNSYYFSFLIFSGFSL